MNKTIIILFISFFIFSCKNENNSTIYKVQENKKINNEIVNISIGDSLISKLNFVNSIKNNNDKKLQRSSLSNIKYNFDKFTSWNDNTIEEKEIGDINLKLQRVVGFKNNADIFIHIELKISKKNEQTDKLILYKQENYAEALVAVTQYFYIDNDLNLWTLEIEEEEDGIIVKSWNQYKLEKETGKIILVKENIINNKVNDKNTKIGNWNGKYFFEKTNRDELKTSFNIEIKNMNSISITYVSNDEKPETYKNLIAEKIDDDKIKIVFNKKYGEMGFVYIQQSENEFIISGAPISNINPGNDEFPLNKL